MISGRSSRSINLAKQTRIRIFGKSKSAGGIDDESFGCNECSHSVDFTWRRKLAGNGKKHFASKFRSKRYHIGRSTRLPLLTSRPIPLRGSFWSGRGRFNFQVQEGYPTYPSRIHCCVYPSSKSSWSRHSGCRIYARHVDARSQSKATSWSLRIILRMYARHNFATFVLQLKRFRQYPTSSHQLGWYMNGPKWFVEMHLASSRIQRSRYQK